MEEVPINSDTINKSLDMIDESTKETRKELDKTAAKGISKLAKLFWASPIGIKADVYIAERPHKLQKALEEMEAKYNIIPTEYQVEPSSYIALKGVNELNYCLEENHLKEMFQNLLVSDMDSRKQNRVLPAYIEIIKQLSKDDAEFLKLLHTHKASLCSIFIKCVTENEKGYLALDKYIIYGYSYNEVTKTTSFGSSKLNPLVIDNLIMHKLIEQRYDIYYTYSDAHKQYDTLFNSVKKYYVLGPDKTLSYDKGIIKLTDFGKNFIDICLS